MFNRNLRCILVNRNMNVKIDVLATITVDINLSVKVLFVIFTCLLNSYRGIAWFQYQQIVTEKLCSLRLNVREWYTCLYTYVYVCS